jgi:hypothetical protein
MSNKIDILPADSCSDILFSQQSADQLPRSHFNSVEFDGFRIDTEVRNPELEQEVSS